MLLTVLQDDQIAKSGCQFLFVKLGKSKLLWKDVWETLIFKLMGFDGKGKHKTLVRM